VTTLAPRAAGGGELDGLREAIAGVAEVVARLQRAVDAMSKGVANG
jgi:hypothetical protein